MMRSWVLKTTVLGLSGVLVAAAVAEPAWAQRGRVKRPTQAVAVFDLKRGASEAPAVVQAAGLNCSITAAAYLGTSPDGRGAYEVACRDSLGFIVSTAPKAGGRAEAFDCLAARAGAEAAKAAGRTSLECRLPGNADPVRALQPVVNAAGLRCTVNNARYVGDTTTTNAVRYEIGCAEGPGYLLDRPRTAGAQPTSISCFHALAAAKMQCQYTSQAQILASFAPAVAQSGRTCTVANVRRAGRNPRTNNEIIEVGCAPGQVGFFLETTPQGGFAQAYDCGRLGDEPCQFTNTAAVQAAERETLQARLRAAASNCTVDQFRLLGREPRTGRLAYEASCAGGAQGVIAVVPSGAGGQTEVTDCLLAQRYGQQCQLSQVSSLYPRISSAMVVRGRSANCNVRDSRWKAATTDGANYIEVDCADGRSFIVDYRGNGRVANTISCRDATELAGGCRNGATASAVKD